MRILYHGEPSVYYGNVRVESDDPDLYGDGFTGQLNGLCGAADSGFLFLITGLHTGRVGFSVELHDEPPALDDAWEDIVEVSFRPTTKEIVLADFYESWPLDLRLIDYRVRYCATGMDAAKAVDVVCAGEPVVDRYLLQFWPAPPEQDRVVKQTSACAAYWHDAGGFS